MSFIDPHIHMVSRTTEDYEKMAIAGCLAVSEPAFWAGYDRRTPEGFYDYFRHLTEFEPRRGKQFGIRHYSWLGLNPKEAEDLEFSEEVIALLPEFLGRSNVLGIGEIGLNKISRNELRVFQLQVELAIEYHQLIMVHTPHLEDKLKGTRWILDVLRESNAPPERTLIDHVEEHTAPMVLDRGFWAGITLYPFSKCSIPRAVDLVESYRSDRLMVNSGGDWGQSDPLSVPRFMLEMRLRGHDPKSIEGPTLSHASQFFAQSRKFSMD